MIDEGPGLALTTMREEEEEGKKLTLDRSSIS